MNRFYIFLITLTLTLNINIVFSQTTNSYPGVVVVELFTSQGDINSVKADKILSELTADALKNKKPVYCISEHVDFWNRFGWQDPFSNFRYTTRLQNYSSVLRMKETYTPLMVINGANPIEGSESKRISELVATELNRKVSFMPEVTFQIFDDTLDVSYKLNTLSGTSWKPGYFYVNVVVTESNLDTKVTKGDNAGKILHNDNVAQLFYTHDLVNETGLLRIPLKQLRPGKNKSLLFFVQEKSTRQVKGAESISFEK